MSTQELDKKHIWHPCSHMHDYEEHPALPVTHAKGVWLHLEDGRKILDAISSWWVNIFGHCNDRIVHAIQKQTAELEQVIFANYTHAPAAKLAAHLSALFDDRLPKVFYADNGSAAVEVALKMSYHYRVNTGTPLRKKFVYVSGAYHGETTGALSVGALGLFKKVYEPMLMDTVEAPGPDCYRCPLGLNRDLCHAECFTGIERVLNEQADQISAVIIEPMLQAADGMKIYSAVFLKKLRALTADLGIHLICDEIAAGFGRTGTMMATHHAGILPDFVCVSKGLTGGFLPLSAVLTSETIYKAFYAPFSEQRSFMHSHSYTGNAIACAAACAVFDIFGESNVLAEIRKSGAHIRECADTIAEHPRVGEIRSIGMVTAIELVADKETRTSLPVNDRIGYQIYRYAESEGVLLRNIGDVIYFMPPYTITKDEIKFMTDVAIKSIRAICG
ncbi:MAG: adenosylmethionine--8-amino-7-oxononanoate transaminase [Spirochaetes bacterium]|nr:adenosylmethionine--8-amino-7-oxononanoate transaminase [Spirochaetota bacterium]